MRTTITDLWLVAYSGCPLAIRAPLFNSRQIQREVLRANHDHRGGRADWLAVDLEEAILTYGKGCAASARRQLLATISHRFGRTEPVVFNWQLTTLRSSCRSYTPYSWNWLKN